MTVFEPVTEMLNQDVLDNGGSFVGWIQELLVDPREGRVEYVRIKLRIDDAKRDRSVVVPWSAILPKGHARSPWSVAASEVMLDRLARNAPNDDRDHG